MTQPTEKQDDAMRADCNRIFALARSNKTMAYINDIGGGVQEVMVGETLLARRCNRNTFAPRVTSKGHEWMASIKPEVEEHAQQEGLL